MNPKCPNKNHEDWKKLVEDLGDERKAYSAYFEHSDRGERGIPTAEEANAYFGKVKEPVSKEKAPLPKIPVKEQSAADKKVRDTFKNNQNVLKAYEHIKKLADWGKRLATEEKFTKLTDYHKHTQKWVLRQQQSFQESSDIKSSYMKKVKSKSEREAVSVWAEYGGDEAKMRADLATVENPLSKKLLANALSLSKEGKALGKEYRDMLKAKGEDAQGHNLFKELLDDYVPHRWKVKNSGNDFSKARTLKSKEGKPGTLIDGIERGLTPRSLDAAELASSYNHSVNKVIADKLLGEELMTGKWKDGNPLSLKSGTTAKARSTEMSYKPLEGTKFRQYEFHPEIVSALNKALGGSGIKSWYDSEGSALMGLPKGLVKAIDVGQREVKAMLLGGAPVPFHMIQEGTHTIGHGVNPLKGIPPIDIVSKKADGSYVNEGQVWAAEMGLMLKADKASVDSFIDGVGGKSLLEKAGKYGEFLQWFNKKQFEEIIPGLKYKTFDKMVKDNTHTYAKELASGEMTKNDIGFLSAQQVNAAFGHQNYVALGRSPTIQHAMRMLLLAPDFLEARMRFTGQAAKGLLGAKVGREQIKAMARLTILNAGLAYGIAKIVDGEWDYKNPFSFVKNGKRYGIRTVPADIAEAITEPTKFASGRINPTIGKGLQEFVGGRDWRGQKVSTGQAIEDIAMSPIPLAVRPFTASGKQNPLEWYEQMAGMLGLKIGKYSPSTLMHEKVMDYMKESTDPKLNETAKRMEAETLPVSAYKGLRDAVLKGDAETAKEAYNELLKTHEKKKIDQTMMKPRAFISKKEDKAFYYSLDAEDKKLFDDAIEEKKVLAEKYRAMFRK